MSFEDDYQVDILFAEICLERARTCRERGELADAHSFEVLHERTTIRLDHIREIGESK